MAVLDLLTTPAVLHQGADVRLDSGAIELQWKVYSREMVALWPKRISAGDLGLPPATDEAVTHIVITRYIADLAQNPQGRWKLKVGASEFLVVDAHDPMGRGSHLEVRVRRLA